MNFKNKIEQLDTREIIESKYINWEFFQNKTVLVTGATGLIGTQIVKALLYANEELRTNINIIALARNKNKINTIFGNTQCDKIKFIYQDIEKRLNYSRKVDYIIHTANSTSSASFVNKPVETISSIVQGTKNILDFARKVKAKSIVYLSSMEVYGEIPVSRQEPLTENEYGYVDILKPRSSYQEGKRTAECLCSAYAHEYGVPVKIARLAQTIGAGVDYNDNRVFAQFARNIVEQQDIVLKTKGETIRSYCYITDAVTAILSMLEKGNNGESYNVANPETTCSIMDMAKMLCEKYPSSKLVVNIDDRNFPSTTKYYLSTTKYYLSTTKYHNKSGWNAIVDLKEAYSRLISSFMYQKTPQEKKLSFSQQIFSLINCDVDYKQITIAGIKIKIKRKNLYSKFFQLPIKKNKITFCNFKGAGYGCNPKYIAEEILRRELPYDLCWLVNDINKDIIDMPSSIRIIDFNSEQAIKELATAKIWIDNQRKLQHIKNGLKKKNEQYYIQTWHGSLGIKKVGLDSPITKVSNFWIPLGIKDAEMTDFLISNSTFENNVFENNFWGNGKKILFGHPRNDIFFYNQSQLKRIKQKVYKTFDIQEDKKLLLYVPSYRDDKETNCYNLDTTTLLESVRGKFGEEWILAIRMHPNLKDTTNNLFKIGNNIVNASFYPDIQELLVSSDIAISDYSSCIFDFMLSRKPAFIYAEDIEKYNTERGFYYPLESTPFPVAKNSAELAENIKNFDYNKYRNEVEKFLKEKGCMEDGHASERVVDLIEEIINNAE